MFLCWWCSNLSGNFLISFPPLWFWNSLSDQFRAGRKVCVPGADNVLCLCRMERIAVNTYFVRIFLCPRDRATNWQLAKIDSLKNNCLAQSFTRNHLDVILSKDIVKLRRIVDFCPYFRGVSAALGVFTAARGDLDDSGPQCAHCPCPGPPKRLRQPLSKN